MSGATVLTVAQPPEVAQLEVVAQQHAGGLGGKALCQKRALLLRRRGWPEPLTDAGTRLARRVNKNRI